LYFFLFIDKFIDCFITFINYFYLGNAANHMTLAIYKWI